MIWLLEKDNFILIPNFNFMSKNKDIIVLNGVEYMPLSMATQNAKALDLKGMAYCIVRTYSAGVFAAYVEKEWTENFVKIKFHFTPPNSLSQSSLEGFSVQ